MNLDEDDLDTDTQHRLSVSERPWFNTSKDPTSGSEQAGKIRSWNDQDGDALLESMVDATGQLDLDDRGYWDFHGHSSGFTFFRKINQHTDLLGRENGQHGDYELFGRDGIDTPFIGLPYPQQIDASPKSSVDTPTDVNLPNTSELPSRSDAKALASNALDDACAMFAFVHKPTFYTLLDRIYDLAPEAYADKENRFLALLYMVLGLGCLFAKAEESELEKEGYPLAVVQGYVTQIPFWDLAG